MPSERTVYRNQLLVAFSIGDMALVEPRFERVLLRTRDTLEAPDLPIQHVYFIESGIASIVAKMLRGRDIEVGVIGKEGVTGSAIAQGDDQSPHHTFVQLEGTAIRIGADDFRLALAQSATMQAIITLYARALGIQVSATALANGRSKLEERLARWLLMVHDRMGSDRFGLTHEFLAVMLGARRPGVTVALHILEGKGLIRSNRAEIIIVDRDGLIALADGAYGVPEREYERILGAGRVVAPSSTLHIVR
ncbi:MAG: cyclic nucleotide-binding protein [Hyphomicrobiales bacterium]|nr:cyclic nucleotide-binding protein [Hyphomicrobiales bacterium]